MMFSMYQLMNFVLLVLIIFCVVLAFRHGRKHSVIPSNVNYRANMWALKSEGCTCVIATTACGSLKENIHPGEVVILDQFIDW